MNEEDPRDEPHSPSDGEKERSRGSVQTSPSPEAPEGYGKGCEHQGNEERVSSQKAQPGRGERTHDQWRVRATECREGGAKHPCPLGEAHSPAHRGLVAVYRTVRIEVTRLLVCLGTAAETGAKTAAGSRASAPVAARADDPQ